MSEIKVKAFNHLFKTASNGDIKKKIMEETAISSNHGIASKGVFLLTVVVDSLVHLREKHKFDLNVNSYNEHLELENLMKLYSEHKLPTEEIFKVRDYLEHIPSFDKAKNFFEQKDVVKSHHERIKKGVKLNFA